MTQHRGACCSSPAAMGYWLAASLIAWGVLSLIGSYWRLLHALSAVTILFAMAIGCFANWLRHRTFHCGITGPLFLIAAVVFLLSDVSMVRVNSLFGLAIRSRRSRRRVFHGMAVYEAFRIVALRWDTNIHEYGNSSRDREPLFEGDVCRSDFSGWKCLGCSDLLPAGAPVCTGCWKG
jgi:hypothetical protein